MEFVARARLCEPDGKEPARRRRYERQRQRLAVWRPPLQLQQQCSRGNNRAAQPEGVLRKRSAALWHKNANREIGVPSVARPNACATVRSALSIAKMKKAPGNSGAFF